MTNKNKKPLTLLQSSRIILLSLLSMGNLSVSAIARGLFGKVNRTWVDVTMRKWSKHILDIFKIGCTVHNPYHVAPQEGQPTIIMCNHSSLLDIPISYAAFPNASIRMLAKKELFRIPLFGRAMKQTEFPSVDRKNRHQAIKDLATVANLLESGIVMWIAPEGTRSADNHVGPFKKGGFITAIQAKATIIPIGIRGAYEAIPARSLHITLGTKTEVHVGKPIDAAQFTLENKEALIHEVREAIKTLSNDR